MGAVPLPISPGGLQSRAVAELRYRIGLMKTSLVSVTGANCASSVIRVLLYKLKGE